MITTIYRIETRNTRPAGFGFAPSYVFDEPIISAMQRNEDFMDSSPVDISIPVGYEVCKNTFGELQLFDNQGRYIDVIDDHGHPAILIEIWQNKNGKPFPRYLRLDNIVS